MQDDFADVRKQLGVRKDSQRDLSAYHEAPYKHWSDRVSTGTDPTPET